ncbi:MAG: hypothetical protein J0L58_10645 [Burkholderiales bacterium]|nr:hypothetical protein [Burkholderiales bacterium]
MKLYLNLDDPTLNDYILIGFYEDEWDCTDGVPDPYAELLSLNFPELVLDREVTLRGTLWSPEYFLDHPLRHRAFLLDVDAIHVEMLWDLLDSVQLTRRQFATSCFLRLWPQTEEFFDKVESLGGHFFTF